MAVLPWQHVDKGAVRRRTGAKRVRRNEGEKEEEGVQWEEIETTVVVTVVTAATRVG